MLKEEGRLRFNRYDEEKPIFNEKNNRIPWFVDSNIEILNNIIQEQFKNLKELIDEQ